MGRLRRWWNTFLHAGGLWLERNAFTHAGSLAFYTLFSLAPVVIIAVSIAGLLFGEEAARGQIVGQLQGLAGQAVARAVEDAVERSRIQVAGLLPTVTGIVALLIGATTVFAQLQASLNGIWDVAAKPQKSTVVLFVKTRILSLTVVLALGFILLVSLLVSVTLSALVRYADSWVPVHPTVVAGVDLVLSLAVIALLFAVMFKILPDVELAWEDVWPGAAITAVLFTIGRYLFAAYLAYTVPESTYGAAGSLVLLLLWVYYSSLILLFGAALTKARTLAANKPVAPRKTAVRVRTEIVEE